MILDSKKKWVFLKDYFIDRDGFRINVYNNEYVYTINNKWTKNEMKSAVLYFKDNNGNLAISVDGNDNSSYDNLDVSLAKVIEDKQSINFIRLGILSVVAYGLYWLTKEAIESSYK